MIILSCAKLNSQLFSNRVSKPSSNCHILLIESKEDSRRYVPMATPAPSLTAPGPANRVALQMGTWNTPQRTGVNQRPTKDLCCRPTISTSTPITEPTASPQIDTATSHCNISAWSCSESLSRTKRTFFSMMDDFGSESDSDYTSYWRDWVSGLTYDSPFPSKNGRRQKFFLLGRRAG